MDEVSNEAGKGGGNRYRIFVVAAVAAAAAIGAAVGLSLYRGNEVKLPKVPAGAISHEGPLAVYAKGSLAKLKTWDKPQAQPDISFNDADGKPLNLAKFRGKVVVVNIWATWCGPCVVEMPTLAALQRRYEGKDLVVVPISVDKPIKLPDVKSFIDVNSPLPLFIEPTFRLPAAFDVKGMPSTIIYDRQGREVARLSGEAKWDTPEVYALMDALLARN